MASLWIRFSSTGYHRNDGEHMIRGLFEDEDGERHIDWRDAWLETIIQAVLHLDGAAVLS